ncbi:ATP-binding protein [Streptomyces sp. NBC_01334]|uniref:ATP-binding protein n=1 Tax=Streptomyces sp. NBC_01334 TaxID=2903827 RepID=UPI003FA3ABE9
MTKAVARYGRVDPLCIDALGYLELDRRGRDAVPGSDGGEEKNSVAIASNETFGGWTRTFSEPRLCAAMSTD